MSVSLQHLLEFELKEDAGDDDLVVCNVVSLQHMLGFELKRVILFRDVGGSVSFTPAHVGVRIEGGMTSGIRPSARGFTPASVGVRIEGSKQARLEELLAQFHSSICWGSN